MISIVYITNRGLSPFLDEPLRHMTQYDVLSDCLRAQTAQTFELVVVDRYNALPRPEFYWMKSRAKFMRPRATPWDQFNAFAPSVARNTGIEAATSGIILSLDDCISFGPLLVAQVAERAAHGEYLVPVYHRKDREPWRWRDPTRCGGLLAYPRAAALSAGGWEERFAGCYALEDWEFSGRLARRGVKFVQSDDTKVTLEKHTPRKADYLRCPWAVSSLVDGQDVANGKWTTAQLAVFAKPECPLLQGGICLAREKPKCVCAKRPSAETLAIMREYEGSCS